MIKKISLLSLISLAIFAYLVVYAATSYRSDPNSTITVNEQGTCKSITQGNSGKSYFIPTNTSNEWSLFRQNKPSDVSLGECYTYSWQASGWGSCSVVCGGGTQSRSIWCQRSDGATVDDSYCGGGKPAGSQSCNTQACQYNTNGPYLSCSGGSCPSRDANSVCDYYAPYEGYSGYGDAVCEQTRQCTCLTNRWQSTSTCNYNSFMSGGNNSLDCVYTANIVGQ